VRIMVLRRLGVCLMLVAVMGMSGAVSAQDGLTAEQDALLERVLAARAVRDGYASYATSSHQTENRSISVTLGSVTQTVSEVQNLARTSMVVQGETDNVSAMLNASVERHDVQPSGREIVTTYAVSGEARLVEDVLYLNAALDSGDGPEVPSVPDGWFEVKNPDDYEYLKLSDLENVPSALDDQEEMRAAAADVTLESVMLEDGTTADQITITFDKDGLSMIMNEPDQEIDPLTQALLDAISDDFEARIMVTLDADNNPLRVETLLTMNAVGVDAYALAPDQFPEGVTMDFHYERSETEDYSDVNAPVEPVSAPVGQ
jgi:hypothetical protein